MHAPFPVGRPLNLPRRKPPESPAGMFAPARTTTPAPDRPYTIIGHDQDAGGLLQDRLYLEDHQDGHTRAEAPLPAVGVATLYARASTGYALHYPPLGWLYLSNRMLISATASSRAPEEMALGVRLGWQQYDSRRPGVVVCRYRVALRGEMLEMRAMEDPT